MDKIFEDEVKYSALVFWDFWHIENNHSLPSYQNLYLPVILASIAWIFTRTYDHIVKGFN